MRPEDLSPGLDNFDSEAWTAWRKRLRPKTDAELFRSLQKVRRRRNVEFGDQLANAEALCDAALLLLSRNSMRSTSENHLVYPEYPALLSLGATDVAAFAQNLWNHEIATEPLFEEFGQPEWRLLWDTEIAFQEDALRYLLRPSIQTRSTASWADNWRIKLRRLRRYGRVPEWERSSRQLAPGSTLPSGALVTPHMEWDRYSWARGEYVVIWDFIYQMAYDAIREVLTDELVRLGQAVSLLLPNRPVVRELLPKCADEADQVWGDLLRDVFEEFGVPNERGYRIEEERDWYESDDLAHALRRQCMGAYIELWRHADRTLPETSWESRLRFDHGIGMIVMGYSRQIHGTGWEDQPSWPVE